jgi:hypothetical protein
VKLTDRLAGPRAGVRWRIAQRNGCGSSQEKSEGSLLTRMAF